MMEKDTLYKTSSLPFLVNFIKEHEMTSSLADNVAPRFQKLSLTDKVILRGERVYLAHPYSGKKDNILETSLIANCMAKFGVVDCSVISPLHNFVWCEYHEKGTEEYIKELAECLMLLQVCDVLIVSGDWRESFGCSIEVLLADLYGMPIYEIDRNAISRLESFEK